MFRSLQFARQVLGARTQLGFNIRNKSTGPKEAADRVVITDDGSTIVCWHPKKSFPYECSRPMPEEVTPVHSVLKVENKADIYRIFKNENEKTVTEHLMKMTHTTKHRWAPNSLRYKKIYKKIKSDREWL